MSSIGHDRGEFNPLDVNDALLLAAHGYPVFPVNGKRPRTANGLYDATTDGAQIQEWERRFPNTRWGMPTGKASGITVLDQDQKHDGEKRLAELQEMYGDLPETPVYRTPGGGTHYWFQANGLRNSTGADTKLGPGLDIRGDGGYVVVYSLPSNLEAAEMPRWAKVLATTKAREAYRLSPNGFNPEEHRNGVPEGSRDSTIWKGVCWYRAMDEPLEEAIAWAVEVAENSDFDTGLAEEKAIRAYETYEPNEAPEEPQSKSSVADDLTRLGLDMVDELFTDQYGQPYALIEGASVPVDALGSRLRVAWYKMKGKAATAEAVKTALGTLAAIAQVEGKEYDLKTRWARKTGAIYYETSPGRVWEIDKDGWRLAEKPEVRFRKLDMLRPLPDPERCGSLEDLTKYIRLTGVDLRLYLSVLVSYPFEDIPRPVLAVVGEQGGGKTILTLVLKRLLDEDGTDFITPGGDILRQATHRGIVAFDNQSDFPKDFADLLCSLVTGAGDSRRELYSNNNEFGFKVRRPAVLNGINIPSDRPDLLNRSVIVEIPHISATDRLPETQLWANFEAERGKLLGVVFDMISGVLRNLAPLKARPRMADWADIASALYAHLGWTRGQFQSDWELAETQQHHTALDSILGSALVEYLEKNSDGVDLTPKELFESVRDETGNEYNRYFPQSPNKFGREFNRLAPALEAIGYGVKRRTQGKGKDQRSYIKISPRSADGSARSADGLPTDAELLADSEFGIGKPLSGQKSGGSANTANRFQKIEVEPGEGEKGAKSKETPKVLADLADLADSAYLSGKRSANSEESIGRPDPEYRQTPATQHNTAGHAPDLVDRTTPIGPGHNGITGEYGEVVSKLRKIIRERAGTEVEDGYGMAAFRRMRKDGTIPADTNAGLFYEAWMEERS